MPYWNCYYHIVWATKYRQPTITPAMTPIIHAAIQQKSLALRCNLLAINNIEDHIHVAVTIPPSIAIAKWVGDAKGLATFAVNSAFPDLETPFKWQEGYGVVTFGEKNLSYVQAYITHQQVRHRTNKLALRLERIDEDDG